MSYSVVNTTVLQKEAAESAAELHGVACAMLCLNHETDASEWMSESIAQEADLFEEEKLVFINLFNATRQLLESHEFEFDLFLPDDDTELTARCFAISQWCQGFLYGLARIQTTTPWSDAITEIVNDMTEFTKLEFDFNFEEIDEESIDDLENSLMEIREYLRAAVMLISGELSPDIERSTEVEL